MDRHDLDVYGAAQERLGTSGSVGELALQPTISRAAIHGLAKDKGFESFKMTSRGVQ